MIRIGVFAAPVARPLDFVDAVLGGEIEPRSEDSQESGTHRFVEIDAELDGQALHFVVAIRPRHETEQAFAEALTDCDVAILLVAAGGVEEQRATVAAFRQATAARPDVPVVEVVNTFLPPRLVPDDDIATLVPHAAHRGRIVWWRHEKTGSDVARAAVRAAVAACDGTE